MKETSIITKNWSKCYRCEYPKVEEHHCIQGAYRHLSEKYGLVMPLCRKCHRLAHSDKEFKLTVCVVAQRKFTKHYPDLNWIEIFKYDYESL